MIKPIVKVLTVGYTICNNIIPAVSIGVATEKPKPLIIILGRQHPSETAGSFISEFMMRELI